MCLAIPGRIVELSQNRPDHATVELQGVVRDVDLTLLAHDPPAAGDWVTIHLGYALERLTQAEADDALSLIASGELVG
jgi:hydrogenase expression/formation protein HypC